MSGSAVALMWLVLTLLIAGHEAGHALAAVRFRFPISEVAIGIGPALAELWIGDVPVVLRSIPLIGWVEAEVPERRRYLHRRQAWFAAAGPLASLILSFALLVLGGTAARGIEVLEPRELQRAAALVADVAIGTPLELLSSTADAIIPDREPPRPEPRDAAREDPELTSVIGATGLMAGDVEAHGLLAALVWAAVLSAAIGGLNLVPAFGLDGAAIAIAAIEGLQARCPRSGWALRISATAVSVILLAAVSVRVLSLAFGDLLALV